MFRKKYLLTAVLLVLVLALTACGQQTDRNAETAKTADQEKQAEIEAAEQAAAQELNAEGSKLYADILGDFRKAAEEQWDKEKLEDNKLNSMFAFCYGDAPLNNLGYCFADLNDDKVPELLLGTTLRGEEFSGGLVYDLYMISKDAPVKVFSSTGRSRYYLCQDNSFVNVASSKSGQTGYMHYQLQGTKLKITEGIILDASADVKNPWYLTSDTDWKVKNDKKISADEAQAMISGYENSYQTIGYIALSEYEE